MNVSFAALKIPDVEFEAFFEKMPSVPGETIGNRTIRMFAGRQMHENPFQLHTPSFVSGLEIGKRLKLLREGVK